MKTNKKYIHIKKYGKDQLICDESLKLDQSWYLQMFTSIDERAWYFFYLEHFKAELCPECSKDPDAQIYLLGFLGSIDG